MQAASGDFLFDDAQLVPRDCLYALRFCLLCRRDALLDAGDIVGSRSFYVTKPRYVKKKRCGANGRFLFNVIELF